MITMSIEHPVHDFDAWKAAFDADPGGRERGGVQSYRIGRDVSEPDRVRIDLDFPDETRARSFLSIMERVWQGGRAADVLTGSPTVRLLSMVEHQTVPAG